MKLKRICVFCGSSAGNSPVYREAAVELAEVLSGKGLALVYGGSRVGLMGVLARAMLGAGSEVIGVMPEQLVRQEVAFDGLPDLRVVNSMHERKALMVALSDGFIAMPGGLGTLDEFFEVLTWGQLGLHGKPCGVLNAGGYYDRMLRFLDHMESENFVSSIHRKQILEADSPGELLDLFAAYVPPAGGKATWLLEEDRKHRSR